MIDLHCHVLPGVDDGVRTLEEAVDLVRTAEAEGVTAIAATPHVRDDFPTRAEDMAARVAALADDLRREGVAVELLTGGEVALDFLPRLSDEELGRFALGGDSRLLLLEFPYYGWRLDLEDVLFRLRSRGFTPLLAHPERNPSVAESPEALRPLVAAGAYVQLTAASVDGRLGRRARTTASKLVELGLAHVLSSDAHHAGIRAFGLRAARDAVGEELGRWLTEDVPRALLSGDEPPPRPEGRAKRRFLGRY